MKLNSTLNTGTLTILKPMQKIILEGTQSKHKVLLICPLDGMTRLSGNFVRTAIWPLTFSQLIL